MTEDTNENIQNITNQISKINNKRKLPTNNIKVESFFKLVSKEFSSIRECNRILKKLKKFAYSDEFIFGLEPRDLIKLMEFVNKSKNTSLTFVAKLYEVSSKNEIIRAYLEEEPESTVDEVKQDAKIRKIVNQFKLKAKEMSIKDELSEDSEPS